MLLAQTVPATRVYAPNILEIHWVQPVDVSGAPAGPVYWRCPETGAAGRLFLLDRADAATVARNLHRSFRAGYGTITDAVAAKGLTFRGLLYDTKTGELAEDMEVVL